ncbi:MAG: phenylacetic acid degradation operon negative regulatory protein PaaX [Sphingomonadales bacterium]|nr:phenylacetic acid degradation operon negative regulatory protein PaaX [Sphingomonadales bacterium]
MTHNQRIGDIITDVLQRANPRAPSLIISVLGDSIAPHGGSFWIGSLIDLMAPLGLNARLVRTAIFRLAKEDWLAATPVGRRSYYRLTANGIRRFEAAFHRVYEESPEAWDGTWMLVIVDSASLATEERERVRQEMAWMSFGMAAPYVFAHTALRGSDLSTKLSELGISKHAVTMSARLDHANTDGAANFVRRCWDLDTLGASYRRFLGMFSPLWQALQQDRPTPEQAFVARTLLMHEFRRITLRDPQLPAALLSPEWEGSAARKLACDLYRVLSEPTERHLKSCVETADGPLPDAVAAYFERFGGLR